jgi:hypothetical protein
MSEHPRSGSGDPDHALDELLDAATAAPDDEPEHRADFAAVLARAHRLDPTAMPAHPPGASQGGIDVVEGTVDRVLASLVGAARDVAEHDIAAAATRSRPAPSIRPHRSLRVGAVALALFASAAALVLAFGVLDVGRSATRDVAEGKSQAAAQLDAEDDLRGTHEPDSGDQIPRRRTRADMPEIEQPPVEVSAIPEEPAPLEPPAAAPVSPAASPPVAPEPPAPSKSVGAARRPRGPDDAERVRRLDEEARRQLAAGELHAATATLREIVRRGGRGSIAQLAYGDLFTLAHQRGDAKAQRTLWRDYLRKFPRGRFADDARAGLCRHAKASEREACWSAYVSDFPRGAYRDQAARAVDDPGDAP